MKFLSWEINLKHNSKVFFLFLVDFNQDKQFTQFIYLFLTFQYLENFGMLHYYNAQVKRPFYVLF